MTALQDIAQEAEADAFRPARWFGPFGLKGAIYATSDDSNEKRAVGAFWGTKMDGKDVRAHLVERFES